jgi:hypothetical protein
MLQSSLLCGQPTVMEAILSEYCTFLSRGASYQRKFLGQTKRHTKSFVLFIDRGSFVERSFSLCLGLQGPMLEVSH